ncbi:MAG: Type 1 glutamine amidotransferase-like domain-containing protein [Microthrixaceae bacterium]
MAATLALIGGAEWTDGCTFDAALLDRSGTGRVVVVPTAAAYEDPDGVVERAVTWFAGHGAETEVIEVYRRADATGAAIAPLADASFVYLAGGSPMHLRSVLKDSDLWVAIVGVWRRGGVLAASGEAASVLSTSMVDSRGGAFTVGLDLLGSLTVIPRHNLWSADKLHRTVQLAPSAMTVAGIDEATALIWDGSSWSTGGVGRVSVYRNGHLEAIGTVPPPE